MEYTYLVLRGLWTKLNAINSTMTPSPDSFLISWTAGVTHQVKDAQAFVSPISVPFLNLPRLERYLGTRTPLPHKALDYVIFYEETCISLAAGYDNLAIDDTIELLRRCAQSPVPKLHQPSLVSAQQLDFLPLRCFISTPSASSSRTSLSILHLQ